MLKYELIPGQLLHEGIIFPENIFAPQPCTEEIILLTHDKAYLDKLIQQKLTPAEQRKIGFPQSPELTARELIITQGTIDCCHFAFEKGIALNVAGGTHHAFADRIIVNIVLMIIFGLPKFCMGHYLHCNRRIVLT